MHMHMLYEYIRKSVYSQLVSLLFTIVLPMNC